MCYSIIKHCIECNYFTLDQLNSRMFDYGFIDKSFKFPLILQNYLNNLILKISVIQTLCFVKYFSFSR